MAVRVADSLMDKKQLSELKKLWCFSAGKSVWQDGGGWPGRQGEKRTLAKRLRYFKELHHIYFPRLRHKLFYTYTFSRTI